MSRFFFVLILLTAVPSRGWAQATLAGSVKDQTGTPMPRVTVTASSPTLIERVRVGVTDDRGRYRIEHLQSGSYDVGFALKDWTSYLRKDVVLTGSSTAIVNAVLVPGSVSETVTVMGQLPELDAHSPNHQLSLASDVVRSIPTTRSYNALLALVPGVTTNINDIVAGTATTSFPIHGGRANEGRLTLDGLNIGSPPSGNSATSYVTDVGTSDEVTFTTAGPLGETETGGLVMNIVPRSGGNTVRGSMFASVTGAVLQSDNMTTELRGQGVAAATPLTGVYDVSGALGGPIVKDRLWYFVNAHAGSSTKASANVFYNLNAGDASRWLYAPDASRREYSDRTFENASGRATWQISPRHKLSAFWDTQQLCRTCTGATPGLSEPARVSPEAVGVLGRPLNVAQATWSAPLTNRLLVDAGFGGTFFGTGNFERNPNPTRDLIRVVEQCASGCAANGNIPGLVYRSQDFSDAHAGSYLGKATITFISGAHTLKTGFQYTFMTDDRTWLTNDQGLTYRVNNGVPNQLTESISPWVNNARAAWQGLFLQDQWARDRLTLQGAVRFDRAWSWFPAQQEGPSRFLPAAILIPETRGVDSYKDVTVRMGAAYDLAGDGKTALKVTLGKYLEGAGTSGMYANANPALRMPQTTSVFGTAGVTRAWTDANQNFVPDCDLTNPAAQDLRTAGGDLCGVVSNTSFGQNVLTNSFEPGVLEGWGVRPSDWHFDLSLEQQIGSRSSVALTYTRRWYEGFSVVDNGALQPSDLTPYTLVAPVDPRLPGGGGYVVSGLYDVVPEKSGAVDNLVIDSSSYGRWYQYFNGLDLAFRMRAFKGLTVVAGASTGQTIADNCAVRASLPELATTTTGTSAFGPGLGTSAVTPVSPYCHVAFGIQTQLRGLASYAIPRIDVQIAATFQSKPGPMLAANYVAPNAAVAPSLGRNLSGNAANVTVNLVEPGTMYGNRINELDLRLAKNIRYRGLRALIALDTYNALNASVVLSYNPAFVPGGTWLQPLTIMTPRLIKLTAEIGF